MKISIKMSVIKRVKDVRKILRKFRDTLIRLYGNGDGNPLDTLKGMIEETKRKEEEEGKVRRGLVYL